MTTNTSSRVKYDADCLQRLRVAAQRLRLSKGLIDGIPVDFSGPCGTTRKLPGHIFREHKTLHTQSITRRRADEGVQKTDELNLKAAADQSSSFVTDVERSEMLQMRERVRLSVQNDREAKERTPVAKERPAVPSSPRVKRRVQPKTSACAGAEVSISALAHHTLGGKKAYVQEAFNTLQRSFGSDWLDIFQFKPYYYPIFVPIPYIAREKKETPSEARWSFGRTPEADVLTYEDPVPVEPEVQLRRALEKLELREVSNDLLAPNASEQREENPAVEASVELTPIISCFQVKTSPRERKDDPRMIPLTKFKATHSVKRESQKNVESVVAVSTEKGKRTRRRGSRTQKVIEPGEKQVCDTNSPSTISETAAAAPSQDKTLVKQKSLANPFSVRKRFIMPIMRSKKFVVWLHVTNHPEPPYEHSYIRPLTGEEEIKLRSLVAEIPNRPDPLDPDVSEEEYFDRVKEWRLQIDAINEYVAPKPETASEHTLKVDMVG